MCGIFAILRGPTEGAFGNAEAKIRDILLNSDKLGGLSERRGKQSSGISLAANGETYLHVSSLSFSKMVKSRRYKEFSVRTTADYCDRLIDGRGVSVIGHSRLVTHGTGLKPFNNQPIANNRFSLVHNGIITNVSELEKTFFLSRKCEVDSEIILLLFLYFMRQIRDIRKALEHVIDNLLGEWSCLLQDNLEGKVYGFSNTGSLFRAVTSSQEVVLASERAILDDYLVGQPSSVQWRIEKLPTLQIIDVASGGVPRGCAQPEKGAGAFREAPSLISKETRLIDSRLTDEERVHALKRCSRCVLPSTYPNIVFDDETGECNFCASWIKTSFIENGEQRLREIADSLPKNVDGQNCLVGFSGGRDSSYGLHRMREFGLSPIAYTYDWGMVTNLARRNQARICGKLNVEHIWISADIPAKRRNIRKNLVAWLKRPHLGLIPLLMAGDKQLFWYTNKLKRQTGIETSIFCGNEYEKTNFKAEFLNVRHRSASIHKPNSMSFGAKASMAARYVGEFMVNPSYLNSSLLDTAGAFYCYYFLSQQNIPFFQYLQWNEDEIDKVLEEEFEWEFSKESPSSWRIGDATAPFYNYVYYTIAGFTEADTFRSNQIRDGAMTRAVALEKVRLENKPQWNNLQEYLQLINLDFTEVLPVIENMPKLY